MLETLSQAPGLFIGLIGWAATASVIAGSAMKNVWARRALIVFTWMLWMIPAFDATVYQGSLSADAAVTYCATFTGALIFIMSLSALAQRSKQ